MQVITSVKQMQEICKALYRQGKTIGFVPTMGYLHDGHLTLMKQAKEENDVVVTSVFVNPLQFGPNEDFDRYPRDVERDEKLAKEIGVDFFFYPSVDEMYPNHLTAELEVVRRKDVLCGRKREGHFDGVVTVLAKLFHIVFPEKVYTGTKDAQQVAVVEGFVEDYNFPTEIVPVPTIRESDGLAISSRNVYLTETERKQATLLYKSLQQAANAIDAGERNPEKATQLVKETLAQTNQVIDYVELYSYPVLEPLEKLKGTIVIAIAVKFSQARLIDNVILTIPE